jgi:alkanesulfonate monooxygenase SsuD/methylene tetrahydromethanopterin reductase-like flavin-dependent oxidoreductase (luciferase family)
MKELWTKDVASFGGEHVNLEPSWAWPKPVQQPHPPIILGGAAGPRTIADLVEFCDGWMPIAGRHGVISGIDALNHAAAAAGRASLELSVSTGKVEPADVERYVEAGVSRIVIGIPPRGADDVLPRLDGYTRLVEEFGGS